MKRNTRNRNYIFGARATAVGLYTSITKLEPDNKMSGILVSDLRGNPRDIDGCPVLLLDDVAEKMSEEEKREASVCVAVPELIHPEIRILLEGKGFHSLNMLDSRKEAFLMERYFEAEGIFPSVHSLPGRVDVSAEDASRFSVYVASHYKDKPIKNTPVFPFCVKRLYLGCADAKKGGIDVSGRADFYDDEGDNISDKNPIRCEMTAHYWLWKNRMEAEDEYIGVYHYRRALDISEEDLSRIRENDVDVILPFPMIHYPNAGIHHTWYVPERDWKVMRKVTREMHPEYEGCFDEIFSKPYFYNYNMLIAKKSVFADYCAWLYPILDKIEEMSDPKGNDRMDRYTAYLSESLATLYFMFHKDDLKIYHTGRLLYT